MIRRPARARDGMETAQALTCAQLVELVTEYLERALAPCERTAFDAHLAKCGGCVTYLGQLHATIELTGRLGEDAPR
jgi:Putative zinc-finger